MKCRVIVDRIHIQLRRKWRRLLRCLQLPHHHQLALRTGCLSDSSPSIGPAQSCSDLLLTRSACACCSCWCRCIMHLCSQASSAALQLGASAAWLLGSGQASPASVQPGQASRARTDNTSKAPTTRRKRGVTGMRYPVSWHRHTSTSAADT